MVAWNHGMLHTLGDDALPERILLGPRKRRPATRDLRRDAKRLHVVGGRERGCPRRIRLLLRRQHGVVTPSQRILHRRLTQRWIVTFQRQGHGRDLGRFVHQKIRETREDRLIGLRPCFVTTGEDMGWLGQSRVEGLHQTVGFGIARKGQEIGPDFVRFEKRPHPVEVQLRKRIRFVIMTLGAIQGQPEESLAGMFHRCLQPDVAIVAKPVSNEEPRGPERVGIQRGNLIRREHLDNHAVVRLVGIYRFDDPIAPAPNVGLAFPDLGAVPRPVAVTPDVHPMPAPSFPVAGTGEQSLHNLCIPLVGRLRRELLQLRRRGRDADEVQVEPSQQDVRRRRIQGDQSALLVPDGKKRIDRVAAPSGVCRWHRGLCDRAERPVGKSIHPMGFGRRCVGRHRGQNYDAEDAAEGGQQPYPPAGANRSVEGICRG